MNKLLAPSLMRRMYKSQATTAASRRYWNFFHPHSFTGMNNAYNNAPTIRPEQKTNFNAGDSAPLAHDQVRQFPEWYKPYTFNYTSDGYLLLFLGVFALFGWSYKRDICE